MFRPIGMIHDSHSSGHFGNLWNKSQKNRLEPLSTSSGPVSNPICTCMTSNTCTCRIKAKRKLAESDQWRSINILHLAQIRSNRFILQSFLQTMRCCLRCHRPLLQALQRCPPLVSSSLPRGQWPRANTGIVMYCPYIAHICPYIAYIYESIWHDLKRMRSHSSAFSRMLLKERRLRVSGSSSGAFENRRLRALTLELDMSVALRGPSNILS